MLCHLLLELMPLICKDAPKQLTLGSEGPSICHDTQIAFSSHSRMVVPAEMVHHLWRVLLCSNLISNTYNGTVYQTAHEDVNGLFTICHSHAVRTVVAHSQISGSLELLQISTKCGHRTFCGLSKCVTYPHFIPTKTVMNPILWVRFLSSSPHQNACKETGTGFILI